MIVELICQAGVTAFENVRGFSRLKLEKAILDALADGQFRPENRDGKAKRIAPGLSGLRLPRNWLSSAGGAAFKIF
jgi:hypothetical protein